MKVLRTSGIFKIVQYKPIETLKKAHVTLLNCPTPLVQNDP